MASFVSSILHNSANKIESMSSMGSKHNQKSKNRSSNVRNSNAQPNLGSRLAMHASTPILPANQYYHHPQMSYSAEYIPAPPPYDTMQQQQQQQQLQQQQQQQMHSPTPTPSTSWTSEMSALAEKIKDDVTNTFKSSANSSSKQVANLPSNIDRHSISQGMKLVSIAADEYEEGNESVALDIYLTGVDKILMALPNKTDQNTKLAIREKLQSVEERVGILNLATSQKKIQQEELLQGEEIRSSAMNSFILSRIASTISTISSKAYQTATTSAPIVEITLDASSTASSDIQAASSTSTMPTIYIEGGGDPMTRFKRLGQYMIDITVTCAVLVKQSPLPDLVSFLFSYLIQLFLWFDSQYHVMQKAQDFGIQCIKFGLQADERYRLHEFLSEGLYMLIAAGLKAAVAFNETPRYAGNTAAGTDQMISGTSNSNIKHARHRSEPIDTQANTPAANKRFGQKQQLPQRPTASFSASTSSSATCSPQSAQRTRTSWVWPW
ncbi:hypothetical protein MBANPS3_002150 [Mucor bainieri]